MTAPTPALMIRLRAVPRAVWVLSAGQFINRFGTFVMPMLMLYLTRRNFSELEAAMAVSAYGVGHLFANIFGGQLADRLGRRNCIVLSMFSGAVFMLALSQMENYFAIVTLALLTGMAGELYRPACHALLADLVPEGGRVTAYAVYRVALNAGFACGPAMAGFLAQHSFLWLFVGDAVTSALFGVVAWKFLPQGLRSRREESGWGHALKVARHDRRLHFYLLSVLALALALPQLNTTFALHTRDLGLSPKIYGLLLSLNGLVIILCELPLTSLTQRWPARPVMAAGFALMGLGFALIPACPTALLLAGMMVIWTTGEMLSFPVSAALIADISPPDLRGRYMGMNGLMWSLGNVLGPVLGMVLFQFSSTLLWLVCGALGVTAAALALVEPKRSNG